MVEFAGDLTAAKNSAGGFPQPFPQYQLLEKAVARHNLKPNFSHTRQFQHFTPAPNHNEPQNKPYLHQEFPSTRSSLGTIEEAFKMIVEVCGARRS